MTRPTRPTSCIPNASRRKLGHNSKAVHRAYARKAPVVIPSLEDYEKKLAAVDCHADATLDGDCTQT